ncbi:hypothetical protein ACNI3K_00105 [Demequina sp. SO4-13]|uniref:hypothetical protein n=1 Tax=Demequina sp. SO4-13 TaxID=3401027 RepID=UPI003AF87AB6
MADFTGGPGLLAFIATFAMVGAAILLFRSLGKHLRKVRTHPPADAGAGSVSASPGGGAASAGSPSEDEPHDTAQNDTAQNDIALNEIPPRDQDDGDARA